MRDTGADALGSDRLLSREQHSACEERRLGPRSAELAETQINPIENGRRRQIGSIGTMVRVVLGLGLLADGLLGGKIVVSPARAFAARVPSAPERPPGAPSRPIPLSITSSVRSSLTVIRTRHRDAALHRCEPVLRDRHAACTCLSASVRHLSYGRGGSRSGRLRHAGGEPQPACLDRPDHGRSIIRPHRGDGCLAAQRGALRRPPARKRFASSVDRPAGSARSKRLNRSRSQAPHVLVQ